MNAFYMPNGTPGYGKYADGSLTRAGNARRVRLLNHRRDADPAYRAARKRAWAEILRGRQSFDAAREARNAARQARRAQAVDGGAA